MINKYIIIKAQHKNWWGVAFFSVAPHFLLDKARIT
jgi:hypothetical protein